MYEQPQWRWIVPALLLALTKEVEGAIEATQIVDMESSDCDKIGSFEIDDSDIFLLKANPPQLPGGSATRDKCIVELRAPPNRRMKVYISDFVIFDCGTFMNIFDGAGFTTVPSLVLTCDNTIKTYDSKSESLKFSLIKQSASTLSFRFNIAVTTDQGPDIDFERTDMDFNNNILSPGIIVGIAIAGVVIFIALLAIFIYCVVKQRKKNLDQEKAQEPTVYTSANSKVMFSGKNRYSGSYESGSDSHNSSYSSADGQNTFVSMNPDPKGRSRKPRQGYDNRAYSSSDDGGHDRSRDSTGSDDIGSGVVNGSFESGSDAPSGRRYVSKNQENGHPSSSLSRSARSGSARKTRNRKNSGSDGGMSSQRSRSRSGHRSGHRDSGRRSRSRGDRGSGSQRRSRSRSPHSQSSNYSGYDSKGHNRMYDISSMSKRSREGSNSSTSSRDDDVSYNPGGRRDERSKSRQYTVEQDEYGSQV